MAQIVRNTESGLVTFDASDELIAFLNVRKADEATLNIKEDNNVLGQRNLDDIIQVVCKKKTEENDLFTSGGPNEHYSLNNTALISNIQGEFSKSECNILKTDECGSLDIGRFIEISIITNENERLKNTEVNKKMQQRDITLAELDAENRQYDDDLGCSDVDQNKEVEVNNYNSNSEISENSDSDTDSGGEYDDPNDKEFYVKKIYKVEQVNGKKVKMIQEKYKWNKMPVHSKFSGIPKKDLWKKILPTTNNCEDVKNEISAFQKIINIEIIDTIVKYTNIRIEKQIYSISPAQVSKHSKKQTSRDEILAFIGILILLGQKQMSKVNLLEAWANDGTGIEIIRSAMSLTRFKFLLQSIRFDDNSTREVRKNFDKLAPVREFFEAFRENCKTYFTPGDQLTIDEKLEPFRGKCSFIQYIPNKPAKYGIKFFTIVDARLYYTLDLEIYCGIQPDGQYKVSNATDDIVDRLITPYKKSNRNLTIDNWYTSYPLAKKLLENGLTCVGTMKKNKKEIPNEFLPSKDRLIGSSIFGYQKNITLVSYVTHKNKCVILLSTAHDDNKIIDRNTQKPEILMDYNRTKDGVNMIDQISTNYTVSRKTARWSMAIFYALLNIATINALVLLQLKEPHFSIKNRRHFLKKLSSRINKCTFGTQICCKKI